jgi:glutamate synthase (ferredoxin)
VHSNGPVWDDEVLADAEIQDAIDNSGSVSREYEITNVQRSAFGRVAGAVARQHGDRGFAGSLDFVLRGSGGQSFGCFLVSGAVQSPVQGRCTAARCMLLLSSQPFCLLDVA